MLRMNKKRCRGAVLLLSLTLLLSLAAILAVPAAEDGETAAPAVNYAADLVWDKQVGAPTITQTDTGAVMSDITQGWASAGVDILPAIKQILGDGESAYMTVTVEVTATMKEGHEEDVLTGRVLMRGTDAYKDLGDSDWNALYSEKGGSTFFKQGGNVMVYLDSDVVLPHGETYVFSTKLSLTRTKIECDMLTEWILCLDNLGGMDLANVENVAFTNLSITKGQDPLADKITGDREAPPAYEAPADSLLNTHPVDPTTWVFTDGLGRVSLTNAEVGDLKEDKTVAMFYWTWHCDFNGSEPINVQQAIEKYPEAIHDYNHPVWRTGGANFWNESIYGYYNGLDPWVFRRQAELLANAGVDTIFADNSNSTATWKSGYTALMEAWTDAMEDGVNTPKVSFLLPFGGGSDSVNQLCSLYTDIFLNDKYQNLWFYWDDKPMLMAHSSNLDTSVLLEKEIKGFFTFRTPYSHYGSNSSISGQWGWLSLYPQVPFYKEKKDIRENNVEQMTVGVAMNHDYKAGMIAAMNGNYICGRSYTSDYQDRYLKEGDEASKWGYNFAEQWEYAIEQDPKVIFVTGWNEYIAGRYATWPEGYASAVENAFPDQFNNEFSRDIEPSKGDLQDHYYYQMVNYIRQYKGANPIPTPSAAKTIDLSAGYDQWADVEPYYAAYIGNTDDRDCAGYGSLYYTETSGRNDIIGARVARDDEFVYFFVECNEDITPYTDSLWMNLYIDTDQSKQGWNTFEFVVNKSAASEKTLVLEKFTADNSYASEKVADVEYRVDGKTMTVKIPKTALGLTGDGYTVNFAWTDNVHDEGDYEKFSGDIMDFYISGDVAPGGRFKFSYVVASEGGGTTETQATTTPATTPDTDPAVTTDAGTAEGKGCVSSVGAGMAAVVVAAAAAVALKKKED